MLKRKMAVGNGFPLKTVLDMAVFLVITKSTKHIVYLGS